MLGKTKKETVINKLGFEFEIEKVFVKTDDFDNNVNQYCIDEYNAAKMALYSNKVSLYPPHVEAEKISHIISIGVSNYINQLSLSL